jgi:hypothetical protein
MADRYRVDTRNRHEYFPWDVEVRTISFMCGISPTSCVIDVRYIMIGQHSSRCRLQMQTEDVQMSQVDICGVYLLKDDFN